MAEYIVNRPDEEVMRRILQQNPDNAVGAILRLAWQAGLLREEIQRLTEFMAGEEAASDYEKLTEAANRMEELQQGLTAKYEEWSELSE